MASRGRKTNEVKRGVTARVDLHGTPIARMKDAFGDRKSDLILFAPEEIEGGSFVCRFSSQRHGIAVGLDSLQALIRAMGAIGEDLETQKSYPRGPSGRDLSQSVLPLVLATELLPTPQFRYLQHIVATNNNGRFDIDESFLRRARTIQDTVERSGAAKVTGAVHQRKLKKVVATRQYVYKRRRILLEVFAPEKAGSSYVCGFRAPGLPLYGDCSSTGESAFQAIYSSRGQE